MIAKHIPMRTLKKSDYASLVHYLMDPQNKQERVGDIRIAHCTASDPEIAIIEIEHAQSMNQRAVSDKTYHLVVSFRSGEEPDPAVLAAIEEHLCSGLGFKGHQRISVVHHDTDNLHMHVAICKIHPIRHTIHNPHNDYATLGRLCGDLEARFGLQPDNHAPQRPGAQSAGEEMEAHAGVESLLGWIRRECHAQMLRADSWASLHAELAAHGLVMRERGNGLIVSDEQGMTVKASSIDRELSKAKLQARLGPFVPDLQGGDPGSPPSAPAAPAQPNPVMDAQDGPMEAIEASRPEVVTSGPRKRYRKAAIAGNRDTTVLYAAYQQAQADAQQGRTPAFAAARDRRDRAIAAAKRYARLHRAAIRLAVSDRQARRLLYAATGKSLQAEIAGIHADHRQERRQLANQYRRQAWADWLCTQARSGNAEALAALRDRPGRGALQGNRLSGGMPAKDVAIEGDITKRGTVIRNVGGTVLRDTGDRLIVGQRYQSADLRTALAEARKRYGDRLHVEGSESFRLATAREAGSCQLPVTFDDPALEQVRISMLEEPRGKEDHHEHASTTGPRPGQPAGRGIPGNRPAAAGAGKGGADGAQRGPGPIGARPPPEGRHRLRDLSALGMVRIPSGAAVLLPGDVPDHLEQSGTAADHGVRRPVPGDRQVDAALSAVRKYVLEREQKRLSLSDIPKHLAYDGFKGPATFGGLRTVDEQALALLQRDDVVHVMAIDAAMARRLERLRRGTALTIGPRGGITTGGRQR